MLRIAASILAAKRLAQAEGKPHSPAVTAAIHDSITFAERIMQKIDERHPVRAEAGGRFR